MRWSKEARADLIEARRFVAENNPHAASRLAARIVVVVEHLERNPQMGRDGFLPGTRELVVATTPYLVIYEVLRDHVNILGVVHGRKDRTPELDDWPRVAQESAASPATITARAAPRDFTKPGESVSSAHPIMALLSDAPSGTPRAAILDETPREQHALCAGDQGKGRCPDGSRGEGRAQGTGHRAQGTGHRAQGTGAINGRRNRCDRTRMQRQ